jgi:hypothetical protein
VAKLLGDLLERDGACLQALIAAALQQGLGRCDERLRRDQQVVGLVRGGTQAGCRRDGDARRKQARLRYGEVAAPGLGPETQRAARRLIAGEPPRARAARRRHVEKRHWSREPSERGRAGLVPRPGEGAAGERRRLRVGEREAIEEHVGGRVRVGHVRELKLVRSLTQQRGRHAERHPVGLLAREPRLAHGRSVH